MPQKPDQNNDSPGAEADQKGERVRIKSGGGKTPVDLWIFGLIALAAISGGFLSVFSYFGYWQNKETWAIWSLYCLIIFTITAGFLTWQKSINEQQTKSEAQKPSPKRPSLTVESARLFKLRDGRGYMNITVRNSGEEVAQNATVHTTLRGIPIEESGDIGQCPEPQQAPLETMQSVGTIGIGERRISGAGVILTSEQVTNIEQEKTRLYVYLVSNYEGPVSRHSLEFYARYDPLTGLLNECPKHNKAT